MSQENIWGKVLNDDVSNENEKVNTILIKRNTPHKLTDISLRNYFNTHELDEIDINSIYDYFNENMFTDYNGLYLPHLICSTPFISYDKIYQALEETFKVISPNTGSNNIDNFNYFQYCMMIWGRANLRLIESYVKLYELGIKNGLDVAYRDSSSRTSAFYFAASAPITDIDKYFKTFFSDDSNILDINNVSINDIIKKRFYINNSSRDEFSYEKMIKYSDIFQKLTSNEFYYKYSFDKGKEVTTEEWKTYEKIEKKLQKIKVKTK